MNRKQIKAQSKTLIKTADPKPVLMAIIFIFVSALLSYLSYKLVGSYRMEMQSILSQGDVLDESRVMYLLEKAAPSPAAVLLNIAIEIVSIVLGAGFAIFCLNTVRARQSSYWNLFDGFGMFWRVIWLSILQAIFVFLWSLLFVIPGIIAAYRYRMSLYLLLEHPEMDPLACINESKRIMKGHKWELFCFDLSFIGWLMLVALAVSLGITLAEYMSPSFATEFLNVIGLGVFVQFFVLPYMDLSYAGYYVELTRPAQDAPFGDGWTPEL